MSSSCSTLGQGSANGDTAKRTDNCSRSSGEPERKRKGSVGRESVITSHFEEKTLWRGLSSISWWAPRHPYRGDGPVNAFELRVLRHPSRPFFPSPSTIKFTGTRERGEGALKRGVRNTHVFSFGGAVEYSI